MRNGGVMALIYVVEDDKNISEIESFALKNAGHQIVECASGKEFHKQVIERIPDLILLDIMLPDEDGLQILTKMHLYILNFCHRELHL
jgi:two-component system, OmpR family, alkaline phosphatase synthesis response regulator PhoP